MTLYFSPSLRISKPNYSTSQSNDNQQDATVQIVRFPCGIESILRCHILCKMYLNVVIGSVIIIDSNHKSFSSSRRKQSVQEKKTNKRPKPIKLAKLLKCIQPYSGYLILRRTHWCPNEYRFIAEPTILSCSNIFTPSKLKTVVDDMLFYIGYSSSFSESFSYRTAI